MSTRATAKVRVTTRSTASVRSVGRLKAGLAMGRPGPPGETYPEGGIAGQVLTKTALGVEWKDATGGTAELEEHASTHAAGGSDPVTLAQSQVTGLTEALAGKAPTSHNHAIADVTGLQGALDGKQAAGSYVTTDDSRLSDPRTPTAHTHPISDVTGLQAALDGKAPTSHSHAASDITSGTLALARLPVADSGESSSTEVVRADDSRLSDPRTPTSHSHAIADVTGLQTALDAKSPTLNDTGTGFSLIANASTGKVKKAKAGANTTITEDADSITIASTASGGGVVTTAIGSIAQYQTTSLTPTTPEDATIPQITEGVEVGTVTITPSTANGFIVVQVTGLTASANVGNNFCFALFESGTNDALAEVRWQRVGSSSTVVAAVPTLTARLANSATTARTFSLRVGTGGTGRQFGLNISSDGTGNLYSATGQIIAYHFPA